MRGGSRRRAKGSRHNASAVAQLAIATALARHPIEARPAGIRMPASATPMGTPVCLIEKNKPLALAGTWWASTAAAAGLTRP